MIGEILILCIAILLNGFFAGAELAIVSARKARLKQRAEEGDKGAAAALELGEDSGRFLSSVQIGITLIAVFTGAYGGAKLSEPLGEWLLQFNLMSPEATDEVAFGIVIAVITYASLIFGELVPKRLALLHAEGFAAAVSRFMRLFARVGRPFVVLLQASSDLVMRLVPMPSADDQAMTEEEVRAVIAEGAETGLFEAAEHQMLEGVLRLGDRTVRAIMTPRQDVVWLDVSLSPEDQLLAFMQKDNSRLPIARGKLDEVVGVIYAKDVLKASLRGETPDLVALAREPLMVHDATSVLRLVDLFRSTRQHLAVVVDEHGSVEGIVTTTDILETVTGTLPDAGDDYSTQMVERADGSWLVDAMIPIDELQSHLTLKGMKDEDDDFHTLAGFVLKVLGHLPKVGEKFIWEEHTFEVLDMDGRRIDKVLVAPPAKTEEPVKE